jgi:hypothetical protein
MKWLHQDEAGAGEIRRRSFKTADVEEAKRLVAEYALNTEQHNKSADHLI